MFAGHSKRAHPSQKGEETHDTWTRIVLHLSWGRTFGTLPDRRSQQSREVNCAARHRALPKMPGVIAKTEDEESAPGIEQIVSELREDEDLRVFLEPGFEPSRHVGQVVREGRVAAALQNSQRAEAILSARVREEVIERKEALLAEVEAVAALEKEVATVAHGVSTLSTASSALAEALEGPYRPMQRSCSFACKTFVTLLIFSLPYQGSDIALRSCPMLVFCPSTQLCLLTPQFSLPQRRH